MTQREHQREHHGRPLPQPNPRLVWVLVVCVLLVGGLTPIIALAEGGQIGPDVIVGDVFQIAKWGTVGSITGYSIGTVACNIGDDLLPWFDDNNDHPLIAQHAYRLANGTIEQIGISWLKHGFGALAQSACGPCQDSGTLDLLGIGCSDPYTASLNGNQAGFFGVAGLGPRSEVNATTGVYPFPYGSQGQSGNDIYKRLQIHVNDLDPAMNPGAQYFVEGHYVTAADAMAGNGANNVSHRKVTVGSLSGGGYDLALTGTTFREEPAILAWAASDPGVMIDTVDVPGDGRYLLGSKATDLGGGQWKYEYALYNLNSDRSARALSLELPVGAQVAFSGFHDVDYHSGEPYDGTDWAAVIPASATGGTLKFCTSAFSQDENANALRWGTLYNYRFEVDVAPTDSGCINVDLFKPGTPNRIAFQAWAPVPRTVGQVTAGNVNAGAGPIEDVLLINGQTGTGEDRRVVVSQGSPITLDVALPSSMPTEACFALWVWTRAPGFETITKAPFDLGFTGLPTPLTASLGPQPRFVANVFPSQFDSLLGANNWPGAVGKAPIRLLDHPGINRTAIAYFQALIQDGNAENGLASFSNGLTLEIP